MATYTVYNYNAPSSRKDAYKDYMPDYRTHSYTRPKDTYSDFDSPYASDILQAQSQLDRVDENKPKAYDSAYSNRINQLINQMANRKFSYDINGDALYQQYKKQYMEQGKQAMQDTMGQAAALTGGYGNSYASSVGNQAYQSYLGQLNDRIPELYQLALDRYNTEGADMQTLYSMMSDQEAQDYGKYRDSVADYQTDRGYYDTRLQNLRTMGQNLWGQNWDNYLSVQSMNDTNYQNAVDAALSRLSQEWDNYHWAKEQTQHNYEQAVAEDQWNANFAENQRQYNETMAENQRQYNQTYNYNKAKDDYDNKVAALEKQQAAVESQAKVNSFIMNLMTPEQLKGPRGNNHGYSSYKAYVEAMINRSDLNNEQRTEVARRYGLL